MSCILYLFARQSFGRLYFSHFINKTCAGAFKWHNSHSYQHNATPWTISKVYSLASEGRENTCDMLYGKCLSVRGRFGLTRLHGFENWHFFWKSPIMKYSVIVCISSVIIMHSGTWLCHVKHNDWQPIEMHNKYCFFSSLRTSVKDLLASRGEIADCKQPNNPPFTLFLSKCARELNG